MDDLGRGWKFKDERGNVYGRLTVRVQSGFTKKGLAQWLCDCSCGGNKIVAGDKLRCGDVKSCGCWKKDHGKNVHKLTDQERVDRATKPRECSKCGLVKPPEAFSKIIRRRCAQCDRERERAWRGPDYRFMHVRGKYGITKEQFMAMMTDQGEVCAICGGPPAYGKKYFDIDHDHKKKKGEVGFIRGLLCAPCNKSLGTMRDDPVRLRAAADYLERAAQNKTCILYRTAP